MLLQSPDRGGELLLSVRGLRSKLRQAPVKLRERGIGVCEVLSERRRGGELARNRVVVAGGGRGMCRGCLRAGLRVA